MGTGDYVCVTLRGGAPWGFRLRQGAQEMQHPLQVFEIEEDSRAALVGLCENDELLSVNGKSCSNLSLSEAIDLIEASADCLQLLVKRCCSQPSKSLKSVSTTLRIPSPSRPHDPQELYIFESQDEAYYGETDSDAECQGGPRLIRTQVQIPSSRSKGRNSYAQRGGNTRIEVTPGSVVELQLSLSKTTLEQPQCTSLGSASGFVGDVYHKTNENFTTFTPGFPLYIPRQDRQPLGQRGVLVSKTPAFQKQLKVIVQQLCGSEKEGADANDRLDSPGEEGGHTEEVPTSSSVSFGLPSEEWDSESEREVKQPNKHRARHARLRRSESLSDKQVKEAKSKCKRIALLLTAPAPNLNNKGVLMFKKHRQRAKKYTLVSYGTGEDEPHFEDDSEDDDDKEEHAVEITILATGETEVDEDFFTEASGRKRIVNFDWDTGLLEIERQIDSQQDMEELPETKGKGALMFAQRKQRMDEIVAEHEELRRKGIPVDGLQDPDPHQMYQHTDEHTYMQAQETQNYMDVNLHHSMSTQKQQEQQYQQYQEQYYQQQPQQQPQQQQYQDYQQQLQYQQQYQQQQDYQQQKMIQQLQSYNQQQHFQQQQVQQYSHHMNGMFDQQKNEMQVSVENRSAQPFSVQNRVAAPFPPSTSADNQEQTGYTLGQGEQIASRDERISVPAIKTGILQDTRRRTANKPMFTFKESPKVSPNPELLHLLNKGNRKAGFETCPEEDYLSLGAEACNFLQSPKVKQKTPPPVAPKPHINPSCPPWSPQPESTEQPIQQHTENIVSAPAKAPETDDDITPVPVPEMAAPTMSEDPKLAPESQENSHGMKQHASGNAWKQPESPMEPSQQTESWSEKQHQQQVSSSHHVPPPPVQSDMSARSWDPALTQAHQHPPASAWGTNEVQLQVQSQKQSHAHSQWTIQSQRSADVQLQAPAAPQSQPSWVTQTQTPPQTKHQPPPQIQPQSQINSWAPGPNQSTPQPPWSQAHESAHLSLSIWQQNQGHVQPSWAQQQQIQESQPSWASAPQQQQQHSWVSQAKPQLPTQPPANTWTQPQSPVQAPWSQQTQAPTQPTALMQHPTNHWDPMASQSQPQPQWAQEPASQQHPQQIMSTWTPGQSQIQPPWGQTQPSPQPQVQPPWGQKPQQQASQPPVSQWTPPQSQSQPAVNAWASQHKQSSINMAQTETQKLPSQPIKPWSPPQNTQPTTPRRMNSYTSGAKVSSPNPPSSIMTLSGFGSAFEMPALRGKGAELFAKRQSRMEKYIVDSTTVQSNKARPPSPSPSLSNSWKYSPNCRAPPPLAYNPIHSPSYPPGAIKQPPSSSPSIKNKNKSKEKDKPAPKPLHAIDVMKHQPYQLISSLFTYGPAAEKLAAEKEAAEKLAAQNASESQAQALGPPNQNQQITYNQGPPPYGFMPQHAQQPYGTADQSPIMHDGPYNQVPPSTYQPVLNNYQQQQPSFPYQQEYNPQQAYQQPHLGPYQQAPSSPYQQPSPSSYQTGPNPVYPAGPALSSQPVLSSYTVPSTVPTFPAAARADSVTGASIAPKPKFSAKKSAAQVWKPGTAENAEK